MGQLSDEIQSDFFPFVFCEKRIKIKDFLNLDKYGKG